MSMICWVLGLSSAQIAAVRSSRSLVSDLARVTQERQLEDRLAEVMSQMAPEKRAAADAQPQAQTGANAGA